jgi:hypothetical protein
LKKLKRVARSPKIFYSNAQHTRGSEFATVHVPGYCLK